MSDFLNEDVHDRDEIIYHINGSHAAAAKDSNHHSSRGSNRSTAQHHRLESQKSFDVDPESTSDAFKPIKPRMVSNDQHNYAQEHAKNRGYY